MSSLLSSTDEILATRPARVMLEAFRAGRLSHSLILSCEELEPIEQIAHHLAMEILKSSDSLETLNRHPDFFTLRPAGKMRQISAGSIRELIRSVHHSSHEGGAKVGIIFEADRMHQASANIFLKTLEEPPADTSLLLLTTRPHYLLPTIRSRCLHFRFPINKSEQTEGPIKEWLDDFSSWLEAMAGGLQSKSDISRQLIGAYGLTSRLTPMLKAVVEEDWKAQRESLPEDVGDDEKEAIAESIRIGLRDEVFASIEHRLRDFARPHLKDPSALRAFARSIADLEKMAGLLIVNLPEGAALEGFLLSALRHWGRRK